MHELMLQGAPNMIRMRRSGLVLLSPWTRKGANEKAAAEAAQEAEAAAWLENKRASEAEAEG